MASRPTAVNLRWALDDLRNLLAPLPHAKRADAAYRRAAEICDEDAEICRRIGESGLGLIRKLKPRGDRINALTHCNAGWLATVVGAPRWRRSTGRTMPASRSMSGSTKPGPVIKVPA